MSRFNHDQLQNDYFNIFQNNTNNVGINEKSITTGFIQDNTGSINSTQKNGTARYFSSNDVDLYFDDIYIDQALEIQFQVNQNTMPLTGYNSYVYDDVAVGSRLVQGSFVVNFTKANYIHEIVKTLSTLLEFNNKDDVVKVISKTQYDIDTNEESFRAKPDVEKYDSEIMKWRKAPLWDRGFNIVISYGLVNNKKEGSTSIILSGVRITGVQQMVGIGQQVVEAYSFLARDIQFLTSDNTQSPSEDKEENPDLFEITNVISYKNYDSTLNKNVLLISYAVIPKTSELTILSVGTIYGEMSGQYLHHNNFENIQDQLEDAKYLTLDKLSAEIEIKYKNKTQNENTIKIIQEINV